MCLYYARPGHPVCKLNHTPFHDSVRGQTKQWVSLTRIAFVLFPLHTKCNPEGQSQNQHHSTLAEQQTRSDSSFENPRWGVCEIWGPTMTQAASQNSQPERKKLKTQAETETSFVQDPRSPTITRCLSSPLFILWRQNRTCFRAWHFMNSPADCVFAYVNWPALSFCLYYN